MKKYALKDCATGKEAVYPTWVRVYEEGEELVFVFEGEHSQCHCVSNRYNGIHSEGDAFEILIGTDPARRVYYEIEVSPNNDLMLCEMTYCGADCTKGYEPILKLNFVEKADCFVRTETKKANGGYSALVRIQKAALKPEQGEIYFNAYRLETDGGEEMNKHLFALNPTGHPKFHVPDKYLRLKDYLG